MLTSDARVSEKHVPSDLLCVNTIRTLCIDAVQQANSGHPGTPMGMAPVVYELWQHHLRFDPADPIWPGRDRFVLSAGHASSEVSLCLDAQDALAKQGIPARVVSMPSWELFEQQDARYRESVLPTAITARVSVELAGTFGWERYVGLTGRKIGMKTFGASAPLKELQKKFGFTAEAVAAAARATLNH